MLSPACASSPPDPYFGDKPRLVIGVDHEAEASAVVRQQEGHGYYEVRRVSGRGFTALGFEQISGDAEGSRVRVVTGRGIALALDSSPSTLLTPGRRVRLLPFPYRDTRDVDRDGDPELFVREEPLPAGAACLRMYRVGEDGSVTEKTGEGLSLPRPAETPGFEDATFCPGTPADAGT